MNRPVMQEYVRADIVRAVQWNAAIINNDPDGKLGWPSAVYSDPVELEPWPN